jgi:hypothetical protein
MPKRTSPEILKRRLQLKINKFQHQWNAIFRKVEFLETQDSSDLERIADLRSRLNTYESELRILGCAPRLKYHKRDVKDRVIYALIFENKHCYIGQSIMLEKRLAQHRCDPAWNGAEYKTLVLEHVFGSEHEARFLEYAWRWAAHTAGWQVYGYPGTPILDWSPTFSAVKQHASALRWPPLADISVSAP